MSAEVVLTVDVDWAPEVAIEFVVTRLVERGVRSTWFVTHDTPALDVMRRHPDLFELGIHPNFLPGSTHGATPDDVLTHCTALVPEARAMRTHCLVQSTPIFDLVLRTTPVDVDASLYLPWAPDVRPFPVSYFGRTLLRVPHVFEDDLEMSSPNPRWDVGALMATPGAKVVDLHPVHILLNSASPDAYEAVKRSVPSLAFAAPDELEPYVAEAPGTRTFFEQVLDQLERQGGGRTISAVAGRDAGGARS